MRKVYIYDEKKRKVVLKKNFAREYEGHYVMNDLPDYRSPVTQKMVSGRTQRREDLKRTGCREVDPSERYYKPPREDIPQCLR